MGRQARVSRAGGSADQSGSPTSKRRTHARTARGRRPRRSGASSRLRECETRERESEWASAVGRSGRHEAARHAGGTGSGWCRRGVVGRRTRLVVRALDALVRTGVDYEHRDANALTGQAEAAVGNAPSRLLGRGRVHAGAEDRVVCTEVGFEAAPSEDNHRTVSGASNPTSAYSTARAHS